MKADEPTDDQEVVKIANLVVKAKGNDIPTLIMQLKDIMDKYPTRSEALTRFKKTVWNYDLLSWCADSLKFDFMRIRGGLGGAVAIACVLCECCCSLNVKESMEFFNSTLPAAIQSILHLLRIFQKRIINCTPKPTSQAKSDETLAGQLFDYLISILGVYPHLSAAVLNNNDLIRIIMDNEKFFSLSAISVLQRVIRVNSASLSQFSPTNLRALLDEFVYVLTVSEDAEIAAATTRLLLSMCENRDDVVSIIVRAFKGLKAILSRWSDQGFNRDLNLFLSYLDAASEKSAVLATHKKAARIIWAYYLGWKTRKRMKVLRRLVPILQRNFKKKLREKQDKKVREKSVRFQETETKIQKQRNIRQARERTLHLLEILPAEKVPEFMQNQEREAAVTIQSHWRAFVERKKFSARREVQRKNVAATTIQRNARRYFASKKLKTSLPQVDVSIISNTEREKFQRAIEKWQTVHKRVDVSRDEALRIQDEAHSKLMTYYVSSDESAKDVRRIDSLLARIHTEEETLSHLPSLAEADNDVIDRLACDSHVIRRAAAIEHVEEMRRQRYPWWKKLSYDRDELTRDGW